jgi:stage II sporulation protein D
VRVRLFKDLNQFPVVTGAKMKSISENIISVEGQALTFQTKKIAAKNLIIQKPNHKYDLISIIDFNTYLAGVVSKEMPMSWPLEALKAQAVVARSYAVAKILERENKIFHLDNDQMDQVFDFTDSEKAKKAVESTDQVILKDSNDKVLKAFYHSDCGGQTVPASQIWKGAYDAGTATDPWCEKRKSNEWIYELSQDDFYKRLGLQSEDDSKLEVAENFKGRIQSFKVSDQFYPVQKLREIFGFSQIKNSPRSFQHLPSGIVMFKGKGFGHGAGLCQWGTLSQVKIGRSYIEVLEHYYPKAVITFKSPILSKALSQACIPNGANCIALR